MSVDPLGDKAIGVEINYVGGGADPGDASTSAAEEATAAAEAAEEATEDTPAAESAAEPASPAGE